MSVKVEMKLMFTIAPMVSTFNVKYLKMARDRPTLVFSWSTNGKKTFLTARV